MKYTNDEFSADFTVPDRLTVRQQVQYYAAVAFSEKKEFVEQSFEGAKLLIEDWHCTRIPDLNISLDTLTDPTDAAIVLWVQKIVRDHVAGLKDLPKNS